MLMLVIGTIEKNGTSGSLQMNIIYMLPAVDKEDKTKKMNIN
jgi:hypothetical protein